MRSKGLTSAGVISLALSALVAATALHSGSRIGAPSYWAWLLTGMQVLALWAAGGKRSWGWLLGASVQPVWITYAMFTGQIGFIPGCAISAAVQVYSFMRSPGLPPQPGSAEAVVSDFHLSIDHRRPNFDQAKL